MKARVPVLLAIFLIICFAIVILVRPLSEKKYSNIVEKTVKVNGKVVARYKIAELPSEIETAGKKPATVEGRVVIVPNNPSDINSKMMVAIKNNEDIIVVTNPEYVRTLAYLYFGKNVVLKGRWQKAAIIFGKKYKSFRVEDISLAKK